MVKEENGGGDGSTQVRKPSRLPSMLMDEDSNDSLIIDRKTNGLNGSVHGMSASEALMKAKLTHHFDDDEEIEIVEREVDEDEFGDDDILVEEVDESERTDKFKKVSEIIKTAPQLQFEKAASDVKEIDENQQIIVVPPSDNEKSLHERFDKVCNREMKFSLNSYWQTYNYLKRNTEDGLQFIQKLKDSAQVIANRSKKTAVRKLDNTVGEKIAKAQEDDAGEAIDPEYFWRENVAFWMQQFEWKRRDGPQVSQEELDKEIEEYMAMRSASRASVCSDFDVDADLADFMEKKGIIREDKAEDLDQDLDDYWSKRAKIDGVEKENGELAPAAQSKGWTVSNASKMTPQERMRRRKALETKTNGQTNGSGNGLEAKVLDEQIENYFLKGTALKDRKEKEKKAAEEARQLELLKQSEGDQFADEDFDSYNEAMEM